MVLILVALLGWNRNPAFCAVSTQEVACPEWVQHASEWVPRLVVQIEKRVNEQRRARQLVPLVTDPRIHKVARRYAENLARHGMLRHVGRNGSTPDVRLQTARVYDWDAFGENLARVNTFKYRSYNRDGSLYMAVCHDIASLAREVVESWMRSPGHRKNLLHPEFTHMGTGISFDVNREALYVVQVYVHRIACGYYQGPCCTDPARPWSQVCLLPLKCVDDRCQD